MIESKLSIKEMISAKEPSKSAWPKSNKIDMTAWTTSTLTLTYPKSNCLMEFSPLTSLFQITFLTKNYRRGRKLGISLPMLIFCFTSKCVDFSIFCYSVSEWWKRHITKPYSVL